VGRKHRDERLQKIYQACQEHPGRRVGFIARVLGLHRSEVSRALPALEERGLYLSEDRRGRLYPFDRKS
jgi:Mn-dependent DtxR family transcriptional regulator